MIGEAVRPRRASIVHVTPANAPEYFIVTVVGRGDLCRQFDNVKDALAYQRELNARPW